MTVREQLIVSSDVRRLSPLEAKAARRRTRVRGIIIATREQVMEKRKEGAPKPKRGLIARLNRGE